MSAKALKLAARATVEDAIARIFRAALDHWAANEAAVLNGEDAEGIHEMRVGLRRMRSALADFKTIIPAGQHAWMKRESRWLLDSLGPARNWDVLLAELLAPPEAALPAEPGLAELRKAAEVERARGYARARAAIRSERYVALVTWMRRWLLARRWNRGPGAGAAGLEKSARKLAGGLLTKRRKAVLKLGQDFEQLSDAQRHQLRITLKKLRYTADFFRSLYGRKDEKSYFRALGNLQDSLGHLNDVVVAQYLLRPLAEARAKDDLSARLPYAVGLVIGWHAHNANSSMREGHANWREFRDCDPFW